MAQAILANNFSGENLTAGTDDDLIVETGVTISTNGSGTGPAVYGPSPGSFPAWTVVNYGSIVGAGSAAYNDDGVVLLGSNPTVVNATGALVSGYGAGVLLPSPGTVDNYGVIRSTQSAGGRYQFVGGASAYITGWDGGVVVGGGLVDNSPSGVIQGYFQGVALNGSGTLVNAGTVKATAAYYTTGALLDGADVVVNKSGATIESSRWGLLDVGGAAILVNSGLVEGKSAFGVFWYSGGSVTNTAGGTIYGGSTGIQSNVGGTITNDQNGTIEGNAYGVRVGGGAGTVTNQGAIIGLATQPGYYYTNSYRLDAEPGAFSGVDLEGGGEVTNLAGGTIRGATYGVAISSGAGTVINSGSISNNFQAPGYLFEIATQQVYRALSSGVALSDGGSVTNNSGGGISGFSYGVLVTGAVGTVVNQGTITSTHFGHAAGVLMSAGGYLSNAASGLISATYIGVWDGTFYYAATAASTVTNFGTITADNGEGEGAGVWMRAPSAYVLNGPGAVIHGGLEGIVFYQPTTVVNLGTISGASGAVGYGNLTRAISTVSLRLEEAPGATLVGGVFASAANQASNVLELLSGSSAGTISGFGASYQNFGQIVLDAGATWTMAGTVTASQTIAFAGTNSTGVLTLADPAATAGVIEGFGPHETLVLSGIIDVTGVTLVSGGTLEVFQQGGATLNLQFDPANTASGTFEATAVNGGTEIQDLTVVPPPTISGIVSGQTVVASGAIPLFSGVSIADSNVNQTETVTVTLSSASNGTLSNLDGGNYNATTGVYTVTGSSAAVTTALDGLVFDPSGAGDTTFTISDTDTFGETSTSATTVIATSGPEIIDVSGGSYVFTYYPIATASQTIAEYSGSDATGTLESYIVDNTNGTSYLFAYDPAPGATQTVQEWSGFNSADGAPTGSVISDVVNYTDGETMVYAYNPTSTVSQTAELWSATNSDGSPSGTPISDVVNNTDGTTLVYAYNPGSGVAQTTTEWSATNADGSAAGTKVSAVVDNTDGTAIVYAYTGLPTGETQTAAFYSSYDPTSGAPIGNPTSISVDYTAGLYSYESSITTYDTSGNPTGTTYYSGLDASGAVVSSTTYALPPTSSGSTADSGVISISGTGQVVDPGFGSDTIQFLSGASDDTLVLHTGGTDTVSGFDPSAGDLLDLRSLFSESGIDLTSAVADLSACINVVAVGSDAAVMFDPTGQGGGSAVATLTGDASLVPVLKSGSAFVV